MPHPKVKIADNSGNEVGVTDNRLDVNVAGATMSTGDITIDSEFPAAATITDNFVNPSTTSVMSMGMVYDGSAWDMLRGNSTDGMLVNLGSNNDVTVNTISGFATATLQGGGLPAALSNGYLKVSIQEGNISGFATSALQPSLGTAGTASANVITVQGIASMTPLIVDLGSNNDVTVSGTVTADAGTNLNTSALSTHAKQDTMITHLSEIEGAIEAVEGAVDGSYLNVNMNLAGSDAQTGEGGITSSTQRVTIATDDEMNNSNALISSYLQLLTRGSGTQFSLGQYGIGLFGVRNDVLVSLDDDDNDYLPFQVNSIGALYVTGSEVENAAVQSEPLLIGGRFDTSARTLGNGDAGAVALNASGHVLMDVVDGGQLDTIIDTLETTLTAIETDQAAIEVLLGTIDSDTNDIKAAVEIIDNAISGNEMQVDVVSGAVGHDITGILSDDNPTVGTSAEAITTDGADGATACKRMDIMAHPSNTGEIWVGDAAITTNGLNGGIRLLPGDVYSIDIDNTGDIYVIATVNGENVSYNYFT